MKTCIFSNTSLHTDYELNCAIKFLDFYRKMKKDLGFIQFHFADNCSPINNLKLLDAYSMNTRGEMIHNGEKDAIVTRFDAELVMPESIYWRGIYHMKDIANHGYFDKIIFVDLNAFVQTQALADFIRKCNSGWVSVYNSKHKFFGSPINISNRDSFDLINKFCVEDIVNPFSDINFSFIDSLKFPVNLEDEVKFVRTKDLDW